MLELFLAPEMGMRVNTVMVNYAQMLSLPSLALHQLVQQELSENPALEELEFEQAQDLTEEEMLRLITQQTDVNASTSTASGSTAASDAEDPLLFVAAPRSLAEILISDLRATLPQQDHPIASLVVESLNDHGLLEEDVATLARTLNVAPERVAAVIQRLQSLGPVGIATRDVRECLLAQLAALEHNGITVPHGTTIVRDHLEDLGTHRYQYISRQVRISVDEVEAVRSFLQTHCWPYPAQPAHDAQSSSHLAYTTPDVAIIAQENGRFRVEVLNSPRRMLHISPVYRELAGQAANLDEDEREHVHEYMERARTFLANLRQRQDTLQRISESIIRYQDAFLRQGIRHLSPLTRAEVAADIGVHESTVSRATAAKTAILPNGHLLPFAEFFHAARPVQDALRELVDQETTSLNDAELAELLAAQGYKVARRTVAKYRDQLGILPVRLRTVKPQPAPPAPPPAHTNRP